MDEWGMEHVARWTEHRVKLPIGPRFCILAGATRGRGWSATAARGELPRQAPARGMRTSGLRRFISKELTGARSSTRSTTGGLRVIPASAGLRP